MGQHWYSSTGEPCHWIEMANGNQRDTTLRDARKLNLLPSVTTILGTIDKPGLNNWKQNQLMLAAMTLPRLEGEDTDAFLKRVPKDAFTASTDARDRGSLIHDCLEAYAVGLPKQYAPDVQAIANHAFGEIVKYTGTSRFNVESTVAGDGYGGMVDAYTDEHDNRYIIDWKTKDLVDGKKNHWPEMAMQLAAYDQALGNPGRRCINVFVDRTDPKVVIHEWKSEEIDVAWKKFELLVKYWQLDKGYVPQITLAA